MFCRTCQECGHIQEAKYPGNLSAVQYAKYQEHKCRRCKSESLDFGHEGFKAKDGKITRIEPEEE